ncbi:MAG TPA: (Fe-S)-binding protein [Candidatus Hydrogenedentes bacterium]|nr:(Fe-S)-binding protein [Candidatus Hydrogenedentota bacterium]HPG66106.1 (Fe-S)-binding protein [Candidatus Hydrogenedentota bacterium]
MAEAAYAFRKYERRPFDDGACEQCGKCLSACPVMRLPEERSKQSIQALATAWLDRSEPEEAAADVLKRCTSCFTCDLVCPNDCRPTNLILDSWNRRYLEHGLPSRARHFMPHERPNFRTYVIERLPKRDRDTIELWKSMTPAEEIFYPGCNIVTAPYLTYSSLFDGFAIRGGLDYCCGETYLRMGVYDHVEQAAKRMTKYFKDLGVRRVYMACTAGINVFRNVLPQFGADFDGIEFVSFLKHVYGQLIAGRLRIVKRFDGQRIAFQDSCYAKLVEPEFYQWPRKIAEYLGFTVVEPECHARTMVCCGIGDGFSPASSYHPVDILRGQARALSNLRAADVDCFGVYCAGCLQMFSLAFWNRNPVHHVLQLVQEAIGEEPVRRRTGPALSFLVGTLRHQEWGKGPFRVPPLGD